MAGCATPALDDDLAAGPDSPAAGTDDDAERPAEIVLGAPVQGELESEPRDTRCTDEERGVVRSDDIRAARTLR